MILLRGCLNCAINTNISIINNIDTIVNNITNNIDNIANFSNTNNINTSIIYIANIRLK